MNISLKPPKMYKIPHLSFKTSLISTRIYVSLDFRLTESIQSTSVSHNGPPRQVVLAKCPMSLFGWNGTYEYLAYRMSMYLPVENNQGDTLKIFKFRQSVARPDSLDMYMTVDGTVLFAECEPKLTIDDHTFETGLYMRIQFKNNGTRERVGGLRWPLRGFPTIFEMFISI